MLTKNGNITSEIEELISNKDIIEYGDKLSCNDDDSSVKRTVMPKISEKLKNEIELTSLAVFKMLNMRGIARVDFLYDSKNKKLYVDEVNSIPWCYSHHLWEARNISYKEMLNIMLADAIAQEIKYQGMTTTIDTDIIKNINTTKLEEMK